jgi:Outer membrane protein beta-barrel domain
MIAAMRRALPIALLLCCLPRLAAAQRNVEISAGYSLAHDPRDAVTFPAGWVAGAALPIASAFAVVADLSGQYKTIALFTSDAHLSVHTVMGGVRASARIGRLTEFAQALIGIAHTSGSAFGSTSAATTLGVQPGGGVEYPLARAWSARAQVDVRLLRSEPDATNGGYQTRFAASLVYRPGR